MHASHYPLLSDTAISRFIAADTRVQRLKYHQSTHIRATNHHPTVLLPTYQGINGKSLNDILIQYDGKLVCAVELFTLYYVVWMHMYRFSTEKWITL